MAELPAKTMIKAPLPDHLQQLVDARVEAELLDRAVRVLNEAFAIDPVAVECLFRVEIPLSPTAGQAIIDHPSIIAAGLTDEDVRLSVLGLINGIVGNADQVVAAEYTDTCPHRMVGFMIYNVGKPDGTVAGPALKD